MRSRVWSLRAELRAAFAVVLVALVLVGAGGIVATALTAEYVEEVTEQVTPAVHANDEVMQTLTDMETGLRGYVLSGAPVTRQTYETALRRLPGLRTRLHRVLASDPEAAPLLARQRVAIDTWLQEYAVPRVDDPVGPGNFNPARFARAEVLFDRVRASVQATDRYLSGRLRDVSARAAVVRRHVTLTVAGLTLTGLLVGILTTRLTSRRVREPLSALRDVLTDLIAGDHDVRTEPAGPREVVTIGRSVNALADETERLRAVEAEERRLQERLLEFSREVRSSLDPGEVVRRGLRELGEALRLDRAYVRLVEDGELQGVGEQWCAPEVTELSHVDTPGSISALQAIHRRRRPLTSTDVRRDSFFDTERGRRWAESTGARASMTVPIPVDEVPVGVITCIDFEPREWHGSEMRLAEAVAADLGRALEHAQLYTAQVEAVRRLEALDRAKDEFLSSVSHELRTPLTSINGYVELLEDEEPDGLSEQQQRLLGVVRRNVDRLRMLIEDLLTLSRIESGAFRSSLEPVELVGLVRAGIDDMRPQAATAAVDVDLSMPDEPVHVQGDAGQLARALANVLGNAIKFTPAGGRVDVQVRADRDAHGVVLEVRDTGIGIPDADLDEVFTRFFRAGNAVAAGVPGTGLGLVIVRTIVDNHGGTLELSSQADEGTTVRMTLPYAGPAEAGQPSGIAAGRRSL